VLFRGHGLPPPEPQVHISGQDRAVIARVDFEVIHVTWKELFSDPARVAGRIRRAFGRAERLGLCRWGGRGAGGGS
jgi:hypothetical protein